MNQILKLLYNHEKYEKITYSNILIIGLEEIECELFKVLINSGYRKMTILDLDTLQVIAMAIQISESQKISEEQIISPTIFAEPYNTYNHSSYNNVYLQIYCNFDTTKFEQQYNWQKALVQMIMRFVDILELSMVQIISN